MNIINEVLWHIKAVSVAIDTWQRDIFTARFTLHRSRMGDTWCLLRKSLNLPFSDLSKLCIVDVHRYKWVTQGQQQTLKSNQHIAGHDISIVYNSSGKLQDSDKVENFVFVILHTKLFLGYLMVCALAHR